MVAKNLGPHSLALLVAVLGIAVATTASAQPPYDELVPVFGQSTAYWTGFCEDLDSTGSPHSGDRPMWSDLKDDHFDGIVHEDGTKSSRYPSYREISKNLKLIQTLQFLLSVVTNLTSRIEDAQRQLDQLDFDKLTELGSVPQAPGHCICSGAGCDPTQVLSEVDQALDDLLDAQALRQVLERFVDQQVDATIADLQGLEQYFQEFLEPGGGLETSLTQTLFEGVDAEIQEAIDQLAPSAGAVCQPGSLPSYTQELGAAVQAAVEEVRLRIEGDVQTLRAAVQTAITLPDQAIQKVRDDLTRIRGLFADVQSADDLLRLDWGEVRSTLETVSDEYASEIEAIQGQIKAVEELWQGADFYENLAGQVQIHVQANLVGTDLGTCLEALDNPDNFQPGSILVDFSVGLRDRIVAVLEQDLGEAQQRIEEVLQSLLDRLTNAPQAALDTLEEELLKAAGSISPTIEGCYTRSTRPECFEFCGSPPAGDPLWLRVDFLQDPKAGAAAALDAGKFALQQAGWLDQIREWVDRQTESGFAAQLSGALSKTLGALEGIAEAIMAVQELLGEGLEYADRFVEGSHLGAYSVLRPDLHMCVPYAGHGAYAQLGNLGGDRFSLGARYTSHNLSRRHRAQFRSGGFGASAFGRDLSLLPAVELSTQIHGFRLWDVRRPLGIPLPEGAQINLATIERLDVFDVVPPSQFNASENPKSTAAPVGHLPVGSAIARDLFPSRTVPNADPQWPRPGVDQPWEDESTAVASLGLNLQFDLPRQDYDLPGIVIIPPNVLTAIPHFGFRAGVEWHHESNRFLDRIEDKVNLSLPASVQLEAEDFARDFHDFQAPDLSTDDGTSVYVEPSIGIEAFLGFRIWRVSIGAGARADLDVNLGPGGQGGVLDLNSALSDAVTASNPPSEAPCEPVWQFEKTKSCSNRAFPESEGSYACEPIERGSSCCVTATWPRGRESFCMDDWTGIGREDCGKLDSQVDAKALRETLDGLPGFLGSAAGRLVELAEEFDGIGLASAWRQEATCGQQACGDSPATITTAGLAVSALSECQTYGSCTSPDGEMTHDVTLAECEGPVRYHQLDVGEPRFQSGCAVRTDGRVECWGPNVTDPPAGNFRQVSTGRHHACGINEDGSVECWGRLPEGAQPPSGTFLQVSAGTAQTCGIRGSGELVCWGQAAAPNPPPATFVLVDTGPTDACAVDVGGRVWCWGNSGAARRISLDPGDALESAVQVRVSQWGFAVRLAEGFVLGHSFVGTSFGGCDLDRLSQPQNGPFTDFTFDGTCRLCGLREDGTVSCWSGAGDPSEVPPAGLELTAISGDSLGFNLCGILRDGTLQCWYGGGPEARPEGRFTPYSCRTEIHPTLESWQGDGCHPLQHGFPSACACASDEQCAGAESCNLETGLCEAGGKALSCLAADDESCSEGRFFLDGACTLVCAEDTDCAGANVCRAGLCRPPHDIHFAEQIVWGMAHVQTPRHTINTYALSDFQTTLLLRASVYVEASFKLFRKPKTWRLFDFSDSWDLGSTWKGWYQPGLSARYDHECGDPALPWAVSNYFPASPTSSPADRVAHSTTNATGISDDRHCGFLQGGGVCRYPQGSVPASGAAGDVEDLLRWCRDDLPEHPEDPGAASNDDLVEGINSTVEWGREVGLDLWAENQLCVDGKTWTEWLNGLAPRFAEDGSLLDPGSLAAATCAYHDPRTSTPYAFPCSEVTERMLAIWGCTEVDANFFAPLIQGIPGVRTSADPITGETGFDLDSLFLPVPPAPLLENDGGFPFTPENLRPAVRFASLPLGGLLVGERWLEAVTYCFDRRFEDPAETACECASDTDCDADAGERCSQGRCEVPRVRNAEGECLEPGCAPRWQPRECPIVALKLEAGPCCGDGTVQTTASYQEECDPGASSGSTCDSRCRLTEPRGACCLKPGVCSEDTPLSQCRGHFNAGRRCDEVTSCQVVGPPVLGACCDPVAGCHEAVSRSECRRGTWAPGLLCSDLRNCATDLIGACCEGPGECREDVASSRCTTGAFHPGRACRELESCRSTGSKGCAPPPAGLAAWWSFEETEGRTTLDRIQGAHGELEGEAGTVAGRVGRGLELGGGNDRVVVADHPALALGPGDFSIDLWLRAEKQPGVRAIMDKRAQGRETEPGRGTGGKLSRIGDLLQRKLAPRLLVRGYHLYLYQGRPGLQLADGSGFTSFDSGVEVADGRWHHLAVTVDRDHPEGIRWYLDGALAGRSGNPTSRPGSLTTRAPLLIGTPAVAGASAFAGLVDELEIFGRSLEAHELASVHGAAAAGKCRPPCPPMAPTARAVSLHYPGADCAAAEEDAEEACNLTSFHYRSACQAAHGGPLPDDILGARAAACRPAETGGVYLEVDVCCPAAEAPEAPR